MCDLVAHHNNSCTNIGHSKDNGRYSCCSPGWPEPYIGWWLQECWTLPALRWTGLHSQTNLLPRMPRTFAGIAKDVCYLRHLCHSLGRNLQEGQPKVCSSSWSSTPKANQTGRTLLPTSPVWHYESLHTGWAIQTLLKCKGSLDTLHFHLIMNWHTWS